MSHEKVVAVYDTAAHAGDAVIKLKSAGYSADDISVIQNDGDAAKAGLDEPGFWRRLFGRDLELNEAGAYSRSALQGRAIVTVRVLESEAPEVIKLLDAQKPVDVLGAARTYPTPVAEPPKVAVPPPTSAPNLRKDEEVVRLAEEQLNVGKRQVEAGIARVRRYMVEKPVEASISLHEEHAEVVRKAISDPNYLKDIDWSDRIIEVTETVEQPVVNKTVRVAEEVVIRRKGSDHTETVHDTVRRQQLDVERVPTETVKK